MGAIGDFIKQAESGGSTNGGQAVVQSTPQNPLAQAATKQGSSVANFIKQAESGDKNYSNKTVTGKNGRTYTGVGQKASGKDRVENQLALATDRHEKEAAEKAQRQTNVEKAQQNLQDVIEKQNEKYAGKNIFERAKNWLFESQAETRDRANEKRAAKSALEQAQSELGIEKLSLDDQLKAEENIKAYQTDYEAKSKAFEDLVAQYNSATTAEEQKAIQTKLVAAYEAALDAEDTINDYATQLDYSEYNPELVEHYRGMNGAQRLFHRVSDTLSSVAPGISADITRTGEQLATRAEDAIGVMLTMLSPSERSVYQIANNTGYNFTINKPASGDNENVGVEAFTQEQWDSMLDQNKRILKDKYGIDTLDEFNKTLERANNKLSVRFNETDNKQTYVGQYDMLANMDANAKAWREQQQTLQARSQYGLTNSTADRIQSFVLESIPSTIEMAFDAVIGKGLGFAQAGLVPMAARVFGSSYDEAMAQGVDRDKATVYAIARAAIEVGTEMISGEAIMNRFAYGQAGLLNEPIEAIVSKIKPGALQKIAQVAMGATSEGLEEVVAEVLGPLAEALKHDDYWTAVANAQGEKTADDYIRAALGGVFVTLATGGVVDVATGTYNRVRSAKDAEYRNSLGTYNGRTAYTATEQQLAQITKNAETEANPFFRKAVESGASPEAAQRRVDMGEAIYAEYSKNRTAQQMVEDTAAFAKANKNGNLTSAQEGQLLLDMDDKELGRVAEANANGIVIEYNDGSTEAVVFNGNQGLLDAGSKLADYIDQGAEIADAEYSTGKAAIEEPAAAPAPQRTQVQNGADVFDNTQYRVEQTADGKFVVYDANGNAVGGTYDTYADAIGLVDQLSQNSAPSESSQNASQSISQEEGNSVLPNEQNSSEAANDELNSKPEPEARQKRSMTLFENESEGKENTRQVGNISYVTETDAASIDNIRASKQNYELGGERFSADDVDRMTAEDVLYRLKAWAKKLNFGGIKGFANKIGAVITSIQDTSGANYQIEKSFYDVISRTDSGNAKNKSVKKDYSNRNNVDRAAYEASQSREGLQKNRADSAFMYLLEQDANAKLSDALSAIVKEEPAHLQASAEHILNGIFRKAGIDMNTATVQDGIAALAESGNVDVAEVLGMSEEDIEEIFALLNRANQIEVVLNGKNLTLNEILDGTVELEESDDSTFAEKDFHGESTRKEAIDAIDEDIENLRNSIDVLASSTGHESAIEELEKRIDALEKQKEAYLEEEQQDEREADKNYRDVSNETDILTAAEEEEADNAAVSKERGRRPELGSISRNNQPFIKKSDVPAKHLSGSAGYVRGIKYNGETYYAVSSLEKGGYRNIIPDGDVAKAKRVIQAFEDAIEQQQRTVDYYLTMMRSGDTLTSTQENSLKKAQQGVFDLQRKLDIINGGTYTLQDLWNDNRVPADIKSMSPSNEDIRNRSLAAIANAVTESDAIRGIKAMEGESYGRQSALQSRTQNTQRNDTTRKERTGAKTNERGTALRQTQERWDDLGKRRQDSKTVGGRKTGDHLISKKTETDAITAIRGSKTVDACSKIFSAFGYKVEQINNRLSRSFIKETVVARNGRIYVPIGENEETARLRNKILTMNRFRINQVESVIDFTYDKNGNLVGIVSYGLCKEKNGLRQIWGDRLSTWNHESSHDDFNLADIAVSERQANGEAINDVEEIVGEALTRALDAVGLDYADFESDLLAREYEPDEINGELYAEFTAMMHEGTTSEWDANTTIPGLSYSEAGKKLAGNKEFQNLVKTIQSYADEGYLLYESNLSNSAQSTTGNPKRATFDQYSDESFDALVNDTSYEEASAINGQNYDEYTTETFEDQVAAEQASETALMNEVSGREADITSATAEDLARDETASEEELMAERGGENVEAQSAESFNDLYNAEQQSENDVLDDIRSETPDIDTDNTGAFDDLLERENQSIDDVLDELSGEGIDTENDELGERFGRLVGYQNEDDFIAGRKADYERSGRKPTGEDIYSSEKHPEHWERMQEADRRMNRLGRRSIGDAARMDKITGNSKVGKAVVEAFKDIRTIQKEVMSGSRTLTEFYHTLSNHANERGISQIVDGRIINLAKTAAQLERIAYATESETDKALASAAASRLFGALANNAERVNRIQYEQMYKLVKASETNGKGNPKNPFIKKMQWYNRMQISGGNFWRMIDGYNRGNGIGYNWKDRHELALNRQIKTQAEALSYFADIKADKGYYDFASGKARGKVDSMLNEVTLKMMLDSLAREDRNGNLHFDEVIKQKGFTFEDAKGNQRFVPIEGNTIREKTNFIQNLYDTVSEDIENNSAAKAYRDAASAMFYSFKGKLESTYEALNGYSKQFYEEGKYFPVRYNDNPTAAKAESDTWTFRNVKGRTGTAGKVYRIMPASAVVDSYISQASNYVAFSEIGADLNLLNNGQGAFGSLSDTVGKNFGKTYGDWFTKYVKDMNMLREPDLTGVNKVIEKQRQLMMQGALLFSTSVPIKQTASYFSAMGTLDPVAVMEAWRPVVRANGGKDIKNPFMQARMQGSAIDPDVSAFLKTDWVSRLRNKGGVLGKIVDMTNVMDSRTVANVWKATIIDVKRTSGLSASQLFVKQDGKFTGELTPMGEFLVSTKFENAVLNTQPIFTKQARAEIARTDNMALKLLSTFRTQQTQNYNLMLTAMEEYRADKRAGRATDASGKRLRQTMEGQVLAAASLAALSMIADVMKHSLKKYKDDDDKDKFDPMKMLDRFNKNFAETAAGNWLFVGDLAKLGIDFATGAWNDPYASKEFYGFSAGPINTYMSIINSAKNVWKDINEDNGKHFASNMRYLVGNIATARGIPLNNAYTVANSLVQYIGDVAGWDRHNYEDLLRTWDYNRTNYSQHLYEAVKAGDQAKADKAITGLEQNLYDNQTLEQRLKGIGRTWLKDGEDPEYVIDYLIDYAGMEEEDASKYVYRAMMEVETGHNFYNMQEDLAKGEYTVEEAAGYLQKYAGYDEKFSDIVANEYLFANEYPEHTYEDITDMYVNGELDLDTATDWLVRTSWQTESYARQNLEDAKLFKLWDYEPYARTDNGMNDTYATGEKTGLRNFWNQYQDRFKSPEVFGSIFKDIDEYKKTKSYGNYTYVWDGVETQAGNEASAIIESLNKHIANGDITYDTARLIWTQHYARKTSKSGLWKWVKAA